MRIPICFICHCSSRLGPTPSPRRSSSSSNNNGRRRGSFRRPIREFIPAPTTFRRARSCKVAITSFARLYFRPAHNGMSPGPALIRWAAGSRSAVASGNISELARCFGSLDGGLWPRSQPRGLQLRAPPPPPLPLRPARGPAGAGRGANINIKEQLQAIDIHLGRKVAPTPNVRREGPAGRSSY